MAERRADLAVRGDADLDYSLPWAVTDHATALQDAILRGDPVPKLQALVDQYGGEYMRRSCNARGMNAVLCAASTGHVASSSRAAAPNARAIAPAPRPAPAAAPPSARSSPKNGQWHVAESAQRTQREALA